MPSVRSPLTGRARDVRPLLTLPLVRFGVVAWAVAGLLAVAWALWVVMGMFKLALVPMVIALFPAALLAPLTDRLRARGWPPWLFATVLVVGFAVGLVVVLGGLGWLVVRELGNVVDSLEQGYADLRSWANQRLGVDLPVFDDALDGVRDWAAETGSEGATRWVSVAVETLASILFGVVVLFFYVKDGPRVATFVRDLTPRRWHEPLTEMAQRAWNVLGGYFRGQIVVAAADAILIGIGLVILDVPAAIPLAILVFFGGLFPIVGAFVAGALAVLVALADSGIATALAVLAVNVGVQQTEGNLLEPLVVGRVLRLHPLVILFAVTAGGFAFGILGAFLAVPTTGSIAAAVGYVLEQRRDEGAPSMPPQYRERDDDPPDDEQPEPAGEEADAPEPVGRTAR
ncbi:MAG TPA: AI-2E family transporter [Acidimicrobiales bacterium]|nr:AI-2E family transporter [Acidimicrobiales bacterium]